MQTSTRGGGSQFTQFVSLGLRQVRAPVPPLPVLLLVIFVAREPARQAIGPDPGVFALMVVVICGLRWMPVARLVRAYSWGHPPGDLHLYGQQDRHS
jgi:ABC-type dipeptide/oligopeptide/nickel transport system permease subunit